MIFLPDVHYFFEVRHNSYGCLNLPFFPCRSAGKQEHDYPVMKCSSYALVHKNGNRRVRGAPDSRIFAKCSSNLITIDLIFENMLNELIYLSVAFIRYLIKSEANILGFAIFCVTRPEPSSIHSYRDHVVHMATTAECNFHIEFFLFPSRPLDQSFPVRILNLPHQAALAPI